MVGRISSSTKSTKASTLSKNSLIDQLKAIPETAKHVVIGGTVRQSEERIHTNGKVRGDLIYQTRVECAEPGSRPDRVS
jgi:hypothetical protein